MKSVIDLTLETSDKSVDTWTVIKDWTFEEVVERKNVCFNIKD